jgi:hypothetical protein
LPTERSRRVVIKSTNTTRFRTNHGVSPIRNGGVSPHLFKSVLLDSTAVHHLWLLKVKERAEMVLGLFVLYVSRRNRRRREI